MLKKITVSIDERFEKFINEQVESGDFSCTTEVIEAAISLLLEHEQRNLEDLKARVERGKAFFEREQGRDGRQFIKDLLAGERD